MSMGFKNHLDFSKYLENLGCSCQDYLVQLSSWYSCNDVISKDNVVPNSNYSTKEIRSEDQVPGQLEVVFETVSITWDFPGLAPVISAHLPHSRWTNPAREPLT